MSLISRLVFLAALGAYGVAAAADQTPPASPPAESPVGEVDPSYRLGSGDMIVVRVYDEPDLDTSQRLDTSGNIRLPLLGDVSLANQTVRLAEKSLEQLFRDREFLKAPLVSISITGFAQREVSILGAVRQPGNFQFPRATTSLDIVDLITRVGGFLPVAKSDIVKITRRSAEGEETIMTVDVESMISGRKNGSSRREFQVLPGDRIWVPERLF